ncbi:MAG: response regulator [Alistipes sp.]
MKSETNGTLEPTAPRFRILVAEDNPSNYKLVEVLLRRDYELMHAWDGAEAVELFRTQGADLILMDISMPVMDGYEALRQIRILSADIPVIALTACAFEADRQHIADAGFTECMAKPLRVGELRTRVASILAQLHNPQASK